MSEETKTEGADDKTTAVDMDAKFQAFASSLLKRTQSSTEAMLRKQSEALEERLAALTAPKDEPDKGEPDAAAKELAKYEKRIKEMEARVQAAEQARDDEKKRTMLQEERGALMSGLTEHGVDAVAAKALVALLHSEEQRIARTEDGAVGWKTKTDYGDDVVPLSEGLKEFFKSDVGKKFLPPRGASGSGTMPTAPGRRAVTKEDRKAEAAAGLYAMFSQSRE